MFKVLGGIGRSVPLYNGKAKSLSRQLSRPRQSVLLKCKASVRQTAGNPFWMNAVTWSSCLLFPLTLIDCLTAP